MKNFKLLSFLTLSVFFINCLVLCESGSIIDPTYYNYQYSIDPSDSDSVSVDSQSEVDSQNQLQLLLRDCFTNCLLDLDDENCSGIVVYKSLNPLKKNYEYFCRLSNPKIEKDSNILISRGTRVALGISDRDNKDLDTIKLDDLVRDKIAYILSRTKRDDLFPIPTDSINNDMRKRRDTGVESTTSDTILDSTIFPTIFPNDEKSNRVEGNPKVGQKSPKKVTTDEILLKNNQIHFPVSTEFPLFAHIAKTSPKIPKVNEHSGNASHSNLQPTISTEKAPLTNSTRASTNSTSNSNQVVNPDIETEINSDPDPTEKEKNNLELELSKSEKVPLPGSKRNSSNPAVGVDQNKDVETEINSDSHTEESQLEQSKLPEKVLIASTGITTTENSLKEAVNQTTETEINSDHTERNHLELTNSTESVPLPGSKGNSSNPAVGVDQNKDVETEINSDSHHTEESQLEQSKLPEKVLIASTGITTTTTENSLKEAVNQTTETEINSDHTERNHLELTSSTKSVPLPGSKGNSSNPAVGVDQNKDVETEINSDSHHTEESQLEQSKLPEKVLIASTGITTTENSLKEAVNQTTETEINSDHTERNHLELTNSTESVPLPGSKRNSSNPAVGVDQNKDVETEINSDSHTEESQLEQSKLPEKVLIASTGITTTENSLKEAVNQTTETEINSDHTERNHLELTNSTESVPLPGSKGNSSNPAVGVDQNKDVETEINSDSHTEESQLEQSKLPEKVLIASTGITTTENSLKEAVNQTTETEINSDHTERNHLELTSSTESVPLSGKTTENPSNIGVTHKIETEINSSPDDHTVKNHLELTSSTEKVQTMLSTKSPPPVAKPETELPAIVTGTDMDPIEKKKLGESFKKVAEHFITSSSTPTPTTSSTPTPTTSSTESFKELNKEISFDEEKVNSTTPSITDTTTTTTTTTPVSPGNEITHVNHTVVKPVEVEPTGHKSESGESQQKIQTTETSNFFTLPETTTTLTFHSDPCNNSSEKDLDILFKDIDTYVEDGKNCTTEPPTTTTEHEIYGIGSISAFPDSVTLPSDENISTSTTETTSEFEIPTSTSTTYTVEVEHPTLSYEDQSEADDEHDNIHNEIPEMFNDDDVECLNEDHERFKRNILASTYALIEGKPSMLTFESGSNCFSILRKGDKSAILKSLQKFLPGFPKNSHIIAAGYFDDKVFLFDDSSDQRAWILPTNLLKFGLPPTKSLETISKSEFLQNYCGFLPEDFDFSEITIRAVAQYSLNDSSCILFDSSNFPIITPNASEITNSLGKSISYLLSTEFVNYPEAFFAWLDEPEVTQVYLFGSNGELYSLYRNINLSELWHNKDYSIIPYEQFPL